MRALIACLAVLLLVTACRTAPAPSPEEARRTDAIIEKLHALTRTWCAKGLTMSEEQRQTLETFDRTPEQACNCTHDKFFARLNADQKDRLIDDMLEYGEDLPERAPWKRLIFDAVLDCLDPGNTTTTASADARGE